jgi:pyruvate/2-oxoglutarate dehydrogenase complex dihydrolipoamide dehydrogenase (E3) component
VHARKDKIVKGLTSGIELLFKKNKIAWVKGSGQLAGRGAVEVTGGEVLEITPTEGGYQVSERALPME